jgi:hypothetical protein
MDAAVIMKSSPTIAPASASGGHGRWGRGLSVSEFFACFDNDQGAKNRA